MNIAILDDSTEDLNQVKSVVSSYYESQNISAFIPAQKLFSRNIPLDFMT